MRWTLHPQLLLVALALVLVVAACSIYAGDTTTWREIPLPTPTP